MPLGCSHNNKKTNKTKRLRTARPLLGWTPLALTPSPCPTSGLVCLLSETVYSSRRSDCSVASARNACSWVMFVFHSSRWSSVRSSVVLSSVVDSVLPSVVGRLAVGRCRWSLPLVVLSSVVRSVVGCRPSVVVVVRQSLVVGCLVGRPSFVVRFPSRSFGFRTVEGLSPQQPSTTVVPSVFFRLQGYSLSASFPPLGFS